MVEYRTFQLLYAVLMDFISHNLYQYKRTYETVTVTVTTIITSYLSLP